MVSKALSLSPFSSEVAELSPSQFYWTLLNYYKDQQDDFDKIKLLCRFINPEAAHKIFDAKETEVTVNTDSMVFEGISKDMKGKYTKEELQAIMDDPKHFSELDVIQKA